jgi:hypothetical protein
MGMRKVSDWDYRKIKESQLESNRLGIIYSGRQNKK